MIRPQGLIIANSWHKNQFEIIAEGIIAKSYWFVQAVASFTKWSAMTINSTSFLCAM